MLLNQKHFFPKACIYIMDSNQYAIELVTYLLVLVIPILQVSEFPEKDIQNIQ